MAKFLITVCFVCVVAFLSTTPGVAQAEQSLLKQGMSGSEIYVLQAKLQEYGYYSGPVDGSFGYGTKAAVISFQLDSGLTPDGVVGGQTLQALRDFKAGEVSRGSIDRSRGQQIIAYARQFLGVPYVWAGRSPGGFDCSGFVSYVLSQFGVSVPRMADEQFEVGMRVARNDLQPGDLVFFTTYEPGPSHVGLYIGGGQFIHASSGGGCVTITSLYSDYYQSRYLGARRLF